MRSLFFTILILLLTIGTGAFKMAMSTATPMEQLMDSKVTSSTPVSAEPQAAPQVRTRNLTEQVLTVNVITSKDCYIDWFSFAKEFGITFIIVYLIALIYQRNHQIINQCVCDLGPCLNQWSKRLINCFMCICYCKLPRSEDPEN